LAFGCLIFCSIVLAEEPTRLIEFGPGQRKWMTPSQVDELVQEGRMNNFIDITDTPTVLTQNTARVNTPIPLRPTHQDEVDALLPQLKVAEIQNIISHLATYENRYYTTQTGLISAQWIHDKYQEIAGDRDDIEVTYFENTFLQPSVITRIKGSDPSAEGIVILGGHEDSTAGGPTRRAPGADDDSSGTSTVLEVFRILVENDFKPVRDIEFHAYAAEEAGLLGSQAIARAYQVAGVKVFGMMQLDMTSYTPAGKTPVVGLMFDFVNLTLTQFVASLIDTYADIGWVETRCSYACSDHASWTRFGYPSSMPFEARMSDSNPYIHSAQDTLNKLSLEHAIEFAKIGLSFVVELGLTEESK